MAVVEGDSGGEALESQTRSLGVESHGVPRSGSSLVPPHCCFWGPRRLGRTVGRVAHSDQASLSHSRLLPGGLPPFPPLPPSERDPGKSHGYLGEIHFQHHRNLLSQKRLSDS